MDHRHVAQGGADRRALGDATQKVIAHREHDANGIESIIGGEGDGIEKTPPPQRVVAEREQLLELIDEKQHTHASLLRQRQ